MTDEDLSLSLSLRGMRDSGRGNSKIHFTTTRDKLRPYANINDTSTPEETARSSLIIIVRSRHYADGIIDGCHGNARTYREIISNFSGKVPRYGNINGAAELSSLRIIVT